LEEGNVFISWADYMGFWLMLKHPPEPDFTLKMEALSPSYVPESLGIFHITDSVQWCRIRNSYCQLKDVQILREVAGNERQQTF
jgi:hypothetical protein